METDPGQTGQALRELRRARGFSLRELARRSGCSASFISQIEQGRTSPSLVSFKRICRALDMTVSGFLLRNADQRKVLRLPGCKPAQLVTKWAAASLHHLLPPGMQSNFSILVLELPRGGQTPWRAAQRTMLELAVVLSGTIVFETTGGHTRLESHDAIYFDLLNRHRWRNTGPCRARVLLLNPNFTDVPDAN